MLKKVKVAVGTIVVIYSLSYMLILLGICFPRILAEYGNMDVSRLAENIEVPLEIFSWGFLAICSGYAGIDRKVLMDRNAIPSANAVKDTHKLLYVVGLLVAILIETWFLNLFLSHDYITYTSIGKQTFKGINLPQDGIATALVSTLTIYVTCTPQIKGEDNEKTVSTVPGTDDDSGSIS